jgi:hypothetical protein
MHGELVGWITGGAPPDTCGRFGVCGTDLGIMWDAGNGTVLVLFGDTYGLPDPKPGGSDWRNNVIGACRDTDLDDGLNITWMATDTARHARQIIPRDTRQDKEETVVPTSGISVGPRNYITYMSVREWNEPGHWKTNYAGIAYSDDYGATWTKPDSARWPNNADHTQNWQMCAMVHSGEYVYLFGTQNGRFGPARLARVPATKVLDLSEHQQWDAHSGTWIKNPPQATEVIPAPVGEMSVIWHEPTKQWLAGYTDNVHKSIAVRTATDLRGPWSEPNHVVTDAQFHALYGGFWHPWSTNRDTPYMSISQWGTYQSALFRIHMDSP